MSSLSERMADLELEVQGIKKEISGMKVTPNEPDCDPDAANRAAELILKMGDWGTLPEGPDYWVEVYETLMKYSEGENNE